MMRLVAVASLLSLSTALDYVAFEAETYSKCASCHRGKKGVNHGFHTISVKKPDIRKKCPGDPMKKGCSWGEVPATVTKFCRKKLGKLYIAPEVNKKGQQILPPHNSNMAGGKALIVDFISSKKATVEYQITFPTAGQWSLYARVSTFESHYDPKNYKKKGCNHYGNEDSIFVPGVCLSCRLGANGKKDPKINLGIKSHRKAFCTNDFKSKGRFKCYGGACRKAKGTGIRGGIITFTKSNKDLVKRFGSLAKDKKGKALKKEKDVQKAFFKIKTCWTNSPFDKDVDMELHPSSEWHTGNVNKKGKRTSKVFAEGTYGWFRMGAASHAAHSGVYTVTRKQAGKKGVFKIAARERGFSVDRFVFVRGSAKLSDKQLDALPNNALGGNSGFGGYANGKCIQSAHKAQHQDHGRRSNSVCSVGFCLSHAGKFRKHGTRARRLTRTGLATHVPLRAMQIRAAKPIISR
jgi:hypothetical protein